MRLRNSTDTAWTEKGTVQEQIESRSYIVSTASAKYRRNRKDILKTNEDLTSYINNETELSDHERAEIEPEIVQNSTTETLIGQFSENLLFFIVYRQIS